ncbi:MAG: hypothetical protein JNK65_00155, partial [Deltaproteobacteria bacterium]|nr:hypothetical protein [Deltaproteobacteria bacterium]
LGCGALLTHYTIPTRNPYISDSIGGVIGAGIGVAIPLIIQAVTGGQMPQMPPIDGRGPNTPFGP